MNELRFSRILVGYGVASVVLLAAVWLTFGQKAAEKTATSLAMPCGVIWSLLSCFTVAAVMARQRKVACFLTIIWLLFTISGNGSVGTRLARSLETPFVDVHPLAQKPFDVIVVLGGGAGQGANLRQQGNSSGDRLILAAQMYHQGLTGKLICTGKRIIAMNASGIDPSEQSSDVLLRLGVPPTAIDRLGGRTTSEEMKALGDRFAQTDQRVGVVTSAWHLPRAMRLAARNGFKPHPLPSDFICGPHRPMTSAEKVISWIPQADSLAVTTRVTKEYLGMLVGR